MPPEPGVHFPCIGLFSIGVQSSGPFAAQTRSISISKEHVRLSGPTQDALSQGMQITPSDSCAHVPPEKHCSKKLSFGNQAAFTAPSVAFSSLVTLVSFPTALKAPWREGLQRSSQGISSAWQSPCYIVGASYVFVELNYTSFIEGKNEEHNMYSRPSEKNQNTLFPEWIEYSSI